MTSSPAWAWALVHQISDLLESWGWDVSDSAKIPMDVRMQAVREVMQ